MKICKEVIYIVVEELQTQWLEDIFQYWFLKDISREIKGNGEYFPYYYYKFEINEFKDETLKILNNVFLDRYKYVSTRIIVTKESFIEHPCFTIKGVGTIILQNVICPESFKKYITEDETIEEIFAKY